MAEQQQGDAPPASNAAVESPVDPEQLALRDGKGKTDANDETAGAKRGVAVTSNESKKRVLITRIDQEAEIRMGTVGMSGEKPKTLCEVFESTVSNFPNTVALCVKREGEWKKWTYTEYIADVKRAAKSLIKVGLERFHGVCIMGFNAPEWLIGKLGAIYAGGVVAGIYTTNSPEACYYVIDDCSANVVIVENNEKLQRILQVRDRLPKVKALVQYTGKLEVEDADVYTWVDFMKLGESVTDEELDKRKNSIKATHCCNLVYTSGTTGNPKGVMLSHDNMTFTSQALANLIGSCGAVVGDVNVVSYLPLSHIAGQVADLYALICMAGTTWFAQPDALKGSLGDTLREVRPNFFFGVPRVWEKIMERIQLEGRSLTGIKKWLSGWAKGKVLEGNRNIEKGLPTPWGYTIASMLLKKARVATGLDRCIAQFTGAAPIGRDTLEFYQSINIPLFELYGMSECTGPQNISSVGKTELGKCGPPFEESCEIRIDNPDEKGEGEICYRGRHIFMGYLGMEENTLEAIDEDGWLHSGDIGWLDDKTFLTVTGRIKELIITAGGENIAPVPIENAIKGLLPFVSNVMVIGDRRKFLSALVTLKVVIDPDTAEWSDDLQPQAADAVHKLGSTATKASEIIQSRDEAVFKAIQQAIDGANEKSASRAQKVQKWTLLPGDFTIPGGELGPTLKLRRHIVVSKYKETMDKFYE